MRRNNEIKQSQLSIVFRCDDNSFLPLTWEQDRGGLALEQ